MKKFFRKVRSAAAFAVDMGGLMVALAVLAVAEHVSDPFKMPKY